VKKKIFFIAVALALLIFAIPAVASPPMELPALEAVGPVAFVAPAVVQETQPIVAKSSGILPSAQVYSFESIAPENIILLLAAIGVAMLAGLMRGASSSSKRLRADRGIAKGFAGGRRWV
jgi:hypothetical protein